MDTREGHPTRDELLAMAYVDDELAPEARAELTERLQLEPELARRVVDFQKLELLARSAAEPEPMDHEWARLDASGSQRALSGLGWALTLAGSLGVAAWVVWAVARSELELLPKCLCGATLLGFVILFLLALRARLRTLPYDPYTEVRR